jgi:lipopolysaccharide transport system permease protein
MNHFRSSPIELVTSLWRNRELIFALVEREVIGRYRGSALGVFWSFAHPMFMLAVYTFVFSVVFQAKWGTGNDSKAEFALVLFSGLIVFNLFAECINRSPTIISSNVNYVKRVVFPLEILVWVALGSALFHSFVSILVWLLFYCLLFGLPHASIFLLPITIIPLLLLIVGISWFFAALGVYLRDIAQVTTILTTVLMFLSPIFYPASAIPADLQPILLLNPIAPALEQIRGILMWGEVPDLRIWGAYLIMSGLVAWSGFAWFQKTRRGFADVL